MKGGKGVYNVLTFQKSRGARAHLVGANAPSRLPLNEILRITFQDYADMFGFFFKNFSNLSIMYLLYMATCPWNDNE